MPRVTITVPEQNPQPYRFHLDREVVTIGRGSDNDIAISCGSVSVRHAEMHRVSRGYELRDLDSTNGTKLNGEPKRVIPLRNGLSVKLGDVDFDFHLNDEELEILSVEPEKLPPLPSKDDEISLEPVTRDDDENAVPAKNDDEPSRAGGRIALALVIFLILAAAAFFAGLAARYQKDTGNNWLDAVRGKSSATHP